MSTTSPRRQFLVVASLLGISAALAGVGCSKKTEVDPSHPALAAATSWLKLIDDGQYDVSWNESAPMFQAAVPTATWQRQVAGVRKPLGKLISRKPANMTVTSSLPGAPDGQYVVFQFDTSFENKASAVETVTPMKAPDGTWRVSGYYIK